MKFSWTLALYIARSYAMHLLFILLGLMALIYFFDSIELIRRGSKFNDVGIGLLLQMALFKLPEVTQVLLSFTVLWAAIFTFWHLTQKTELIIVRSAGFSPPHFLAPVLCVAIFLGLFQIVAINPLGAFLLGQYERLEMRHLSREDRQISMFKNGLWLKETLAQDGNIDDAGYVILQARSLENPGWKLKNASIYFFDANSVLQNRVDAPEGILQDGQWAFHDVTTHPIYQERIDQDRFVLPTSLTAQDIEERFSSADTVSFWEMPKHIKTLENSGFQVTNLKVHYFSLLAQPLMMVGMIFIAAGVAMHLPRQGSGLAAIGSGLISGVLLFFFASFMQALGSSGQIPVLLAAFAPAFIAFLAGLSLILHIEEY